jgi:hypothetical protein
MTCPASGSQLPLTCSVIPPPTTGFVQSNLPCPGSKYKTYLDCAGRTRNNCTGECAVNSQVCDHQLLWVGGGWASGLGGWGPLLQWQCP